MATDISTSLDLALGWLTRAGTWLGKPGCDAQCFAVALQAPARLGAGIGRRILLCGFMEVDGNTDGSGLLVRALVKAANWHHRSEGSGSHASSPELDLPGKRAFVGGESYFVVAVHVLLAMSAYS